MANNSLEQVNVGGSDYNLSVPFVVGTGSTAGTWLGSLDGLTEYYDGLLILYKPSVAGASTTTLNINSLGAKTCYLNGASKLTTHYPAKQPILLSYSANQNSGCWMAVDNYVDGNYYDRNRYTGTIKAGSSAIAKTNLIVADENGLYHQLNRATAINLNYPILYANSNIAANGTGTDNYDILAIGLTSTKSMTLTAYKPVYIKVGFSVSSTGKCIFIPTSELLTQEPTNDNTMYILLGIAYNTTSIYLTNVHNIYGFMTPVGYSEAFFGDFSTFSTMSSLAQSAANATTATKLSNTSKIGDIDKPVYFTASGVPSAISYTINKSVPSDAVFTDTHRPVQMDGTQILGDSTTALNIKAGSGITLTNPTSGAITITALPNSFTSFTLSATSCASGSFVRVGNKIDVSELEHGKYLLLGYVSFSSAAAGKIMEVTFNCDSTVSNYMTKLTTRGALMDAGGGAWAFAYFYNSIEIASGNDFWLETRQQSGSAKTTSTALVWAIKLS